MSLESLVEGEHSDHKLSKDITEFNDSITKALTSILHGSANLANMLPTGSVLFFYMLDPILFKVGTCQNKGLSAAFLIICSILCFFLTFTDSFLAPNGKVYYGLATFKGMWTPQVKVSCASVDLSKYRLRGADFVHALLAVLTFFTTTSFSTDVINCFVSIPESMEKVAPALSTLLVSFVFLVFPTARHGVGFPVTSAV